jgi:hypothetical protein
MKEVLLPVDVAEGMFTNEVRVALRNAEGKELSLFADKTLIRTIDGRSYMVVLTADEQAKSHEASVLLPSEAFETSSRWVVGKELRMAA